MKEKHHELNLSDLDQRLEDVKTYHTRQKDDILKKYHPECWLVMSADDGQILGCGLRTVDAIIDYRRGDQVARIALIRADGVIADTRTICCSRIEDISTRGPQGLVTFGGMEVSDEDLSQTIVIDNIVMDTGSNGTCLDSPIIKQLGLESAGKMTINGTATTDTYLPELRFLGQEQTLAVTKLNRSLPHLQGFNALVGLDWMFPYYKLTLDDTKLILQNEDTLCTCMTGCGTTHCACHKAHGVCDNVCNCTGCQNQA